MASRPVTPSEPIAPFVPDLEALIAEVMDEWKIPGLALAAVQNGEAALVKAYGLRDVEAGLPARLTPLNVAVPFASVIALPTLDPVSTKLIVRPLTGALSEARRKVADRFAVPL